MEEAHLLYGTQSNDCGVQNNRGEKESDVFRHVELNTVI